MMSGLREADRRHAKYFLTLLSKADDLYQQGGGEAKQGLELFEREQENIRLGQLRARDLVPLDDESASLCRYYPMYGANLLNLRFHPREQISWGEAALVSARRLNDKHAEGILLSNLGMAYEEL